MYQRLYLTQWISEEPIDVTASSKENHTFIVKECEMDLQIHFTCKPGETGQYSEERHSRFYEQELFTLQPSSPPSFLDLTGWETA